MPNRRKKQKPLQSYTKPYLIEASLRREDIESFDEYPFSVPVIRKLHTLEFHRDVTFFVGENGSGKSTLLEAIAIAMGLNAGGGNRNFKFATPDNTHTPLHEKLLLVKGPVRPAEFFFLRAESYFNLATYVDELGSDVLESWGGRSLHEQSHGESFMALLLSKLRPRGLYLFDEPEAALSPQRQLAALAAIDVLVKSGSQFIIATHSPILLSYPNARIFSFDGQEVVEIAYTDTDHYSITKDFLINYDRRLTQLLQEPDAEDEGEWPP